MKHGSLFSGIGGFDLAAEWMGWENIFHCEWNPFGQKVLKHHFPKSISYEDITKTDFSIHRGQIDIITGGFPCQPYSVAGKRLGKADERHLFPEMFRAIKEIKPRWIIGENVRGLVSWNGGMVFHEVQDDLEREGYEVQSFLIPAASVGAPHRRDRVWFVAYSKTNGCKLQPTINEWSEYKSERNEIRSISESNGSQWDVTNSKSKRQPSQQTRTTELQSQIGKALYGRSSNGYGKWWENFPTISPICNGDDGLSNRLDSITFSKWRAESIKGGGNAIVPQVALQIFKTIEQFEALNK